MVLRYGVHCIVYNIHCTIYTLQTMSNIRKRYATRKAILRNKPSAPVLRHLTQWLICSYTIVVGVM